MDRSRRSGVSRADAAKAKLSALTALKDTGKKRTELFEVEQEERLYDEVRHAGCSLIAVVNNVHASASSFSPSLT